MRRVDNSMKNRTGKRRRPLRVQTSTVRKSAGREQAQCRVRNSFHIVLRIRSGPGSMASRFGILAIMLRASSYPRFASAPRIRRYPQPRFPLAIRTTSASGSFPVAGRPGLRRALPSYLLVRDEFPMPVQQGVGRANSGHIRQQPSSEDLGLRCQATAMVTSGLSLLRGCGVATSLSFAFLVGHASELLSSLVIPPLTSSRRTDIAACGLVETARTIACQKGVCRSRSCGASSTRSDLSTW
ncbi:MAG: hypothetical protein QOJ99_2561 [Bryobacterales bacterium]|jgi:hypothetical protein|nr:hypothetical protein [Bryobacterales bacterium]